MWTVLTLIGIAWYLYGTINALISYGGSSYADKMNSKLFPGILFAGIWIPPVQLYQEISWWFYIRHCREACDWIAEQLRRKRIGGVANFGYNASSQRCVVFAEPVPFQEAEYRHVYANAVRKFPSIPPKTLCASANHVELLDWYWAQNHNFREFAGVRTSGPCDDCGKADTSGVKWGMRRTHAHLAPSIKDFVLNDGSTKSVANYLCLACREKLGATEDPAKKWVRATVLPDLGIYKDPPFTLDEESFQRLQVSWNNPDSGDQSEGD